MKTATFQKSFPWKTEGKEYPSFELAPQFGRVPEYSWDLSDMQRQRVQRLLREEIVVSLHDHPHEYPADMSDLIPYVRSAHTRTGYEGLRASGMTAVFDNLLDGYGCVCSSAGWKWEELIMDLGMRLCDFSKQDYVTVARNTSDIRAAHEQGGLAIVLSLEASTAIENEVDRIDMLYGFGVRQMGLVYSESNNLGSGLRERGDGGLSRFGERCVKRMNDLGMVIDISHSSDRTCLDAIRLSTDPLLITHAGARGVWPTRRMKPDEVLTACAERGGVLGIEAAPHTTVSRAHPKHSLESVMDHFTYCVDLMGIEHVSFGPDTLYGDHVGLHHAFDLGVHEDMATWPDFEPVDYVAGLENPTENFFNIIAWLVTHDYSDAEIRMVIGGNTMRVLDQVWG
ncbi:dipeptidase [Paenarthrobacter sp. YJN-5]|uniref:dipeptidase n=1 Tax=Paenarthrobacter sp. YJN-5 TaxID=2735316 RepID=UPI00187822F2|nr:membrane dipeptidase [Paenarthrobacter sp. YJN-5]QOT19831.1 diguanylate cyclase [Paenarthrobacter sp. YJN-5]